MNLTDPAVIEQLMKAAPDLAKAVVGEIVKGNATPELAKAVASELIRMNGQGDMAKALLGAQPAAPRSRHQKSADFGRFILSIAESGTGLDRARAKAYAEKHGWNDMAKSVQESVFSAGGALVPIQQSSEVIEFLREDPVLAKMGARMMEFDSELHIGKLTGGTTGYWSGEGIPPSASQPTTGKVVLQPHKLIVLSDVSNDLIRKGRGQDIVGEDMISEAADKLDKAGIQGTGAQDQPLGVLGQVAGANTYARAGTTSANYVADLDKAVRVVRDAKVPLRKPGWLLSPTKEADLLGLTQGTAGYWTFRDEMLTKGTIRGFPYFVTTNMDSTKIAFGTWDQLIYGIDTSMSLTVHPDSRAEYDETRMKMVLRADFKLRHASAIAVITGY